MIFKDYPSPQKASSLNSFELTDLFMLKFMELYQGEMKLLKVLTRLQEACIDAEPKKIICSYQSKKGQQIEKLQQIFLLIDLPFQGRKNSMAEVFADECHQLVLQKSTINDFHIAKIMMAISHYNQAIYQWLICMAIKWGRNDVSSILEENYLIEREFDAKIIIAGFSHLPPCYHPS